MPLRLRLAIIAVVSFGLFAISVHAQPTELDQYLHDRYQGKTLLIRGFLSGDNLVYDSFGNLIGKEIAGDWTAEGFVVVDDVHSAGPRLVVGARRLLVTRLTSEFQFSDARKKSADGKDAGPVLLEIDVDFGNGAPSAEQADTVLSKIFLTAQDDLAYSVPDYWKPCVPAGLMGKDKNCRFSDSVLAIPGVALSERSEAAIAALQDTKSSAKGEVLHVGNGITPPKAISSPEPEFSEAARGVKYQGKTILYLMVSVAGTPSNIHILSPLGAGLDAKAVRAVETWRFEPARRDGQPVPVTIAVEVDFHLY